MSCPACGSANQRKFPAEINIHFPGRKGIDIPSVCVSPTISACLDCGAAQFAIPEAAQEQLRDRDYRNSND